MQTARRRVGAGRWPGFSRGCRHNRSGVRSDGVSRCLGRGGGSGVLVLRRGLGLLGESFSLGGLRRLRGGPLLGLLPLLLGAPLLLLLLLLPAQGAANHIQGLLEGCGPDMLDPIMAGALLEFGMVGGQDRRMFAAGIGHGPQCDLLQLIACCVPDQDAALRRTIRNLARGPPGEDDRDRGVFLANKGRKTTEDRHLVVGVQLAIGGFPAG